MKPMITNDNGGMKKHSNNHSNNGLAENGNILPVSSMSYDKIKAEKIRIWKNITAISISFMCLFTAYFSVTNLQVPAHLVILKSKIISPQIVY